MDRTRLIYGLGAASLGVLGFVVGDFALQWQPAPAGLPAREALAYLSAAILLAAGVAALAPRTSPTGALALGVSFGVWVVALHLPNALANKPNDIGSWNAVAEALALSLGGLAGWGIVHRPVWAERATRLFGLCAVIFGLAHFGYAKFTAGMVPAWLPEPLFWAYLTGAGHMAGGLALIAGVVPRLAATLLAAMYATFALVLHLPRVIAAPTERIEWTMLFIALSLTGAAWIVRSAAKPA
jgi:uncharacterized membrane protein YphA (DoxX/SURF4 family)